MENNNPHEQEAQGAEVQNEATNTTTENNNVPVENNTSYETETEEVVKQLYEKKVIKGAKVNYVLKEEDKEKHNLYGNPLIIAEIDEVNLPFASLIIPNMQGPAILIEKAEFNQLKHNPGTFHLI